MIQRRESESSRPGKKPEKKRPSGKTSKAPSPARTKRIEESDDEFVAVDDPAAAILDAAVKTTPWWAISLAVHALILAALPLFIFSRAIIEHEFSGAITFIRPAQAKIADPGPERPHGICDSPVIPTANAEAATPEKLVDMPDAVVGDHIETANDVDTHTARGDSIDFSSWTPGDGTGIKGRLTGSGPSVNDAMGTGGGAGSSGRYGTRTGGGRVNMIVRAGGQGSEDAVLAGLRWLARHQSPDGHWDCEAFDRTCVQGHCDGAGAHEFDTGVTGLAVLAFLGAGFTPQQHAGMLDPVTHRVLHFGDCVRKGLEWLVKQQHEDGSVGPGVGEMMYNHAISALALSEAYGCTNAVAYRAPAQKAINFLHQAQNYNLAWRYTAKCGENDTSVTGWCVMALKSAQIAGLEVAQTAFHGARAWIDKVTNTETGEVGYNHLGSGEVFVPGRNEAWAHHPSMTAVGMLCRIFIDKNKSDPALAKGAKLLAADLPSWDPHAKRPTVDDYYWYYSALALYQFDGPESPRFRDWNKAMLHALLPNQHGRKDGCAEGSWDTANVDRWGSFGGRVYATALNVMTLEVYYRYARVFGGK